jgi:hypothetical protein
MKGMERLIAMRKAGKVPDNVIINFDAPYRVPKDLREWRNMELEYTPRKDYRALIGLDILILADDWREEIGVLYEDLKPIAKTITVMITAFGEDIGWWWSKEYGKTMFGSRCFAKEIKDAQGDATTAAIKGDQVAYAQARARELEAIKARDHG